jgi:hypothetical protein
MRVPDRWRRGRRRKRGSMAEATRMLPSAMGWRGKIGVRASGVGTDSRPSLLYAPDLTLWSRNQLAGVGDATRWISSSLPPSKK